MKKQLLLLFFALVAFQGFAQVWSPTHLLNVDYFPIGSVQSHKGNLYATVADLTPSSLYKMDAGGNSWAQVTTSSPGPRVIQDAGTKLYVATLTSGVLTHIFYSYDGGQTLIMDTVGLPHYLTGVNLIANMQYHHGKIFLGLSGAYFAKDTGAVNWINISTQPYPLNPSVDPLAWYNDSLYGYKNSGQLTFYFSPDNGTNWVARANDLPVDYTTGKMIADQSSGRLYTAGLYNNQTQYGVYYSDNGGGHWTLLNTTGLIDSSSTHQLQTVTAMYADGQTVYMALDNDRNPSAPDIIGTTTGLANLAIDTLGLPSRGTNTTYGTTFLTHNGDFYLALDVIDVYKKGGPSGISTVDAAPMMLYPNPANDKIYVKSDASTTISRIEISSIDGRKLMSDVYSQAGIDIAGLPQGMYFLQAYADGKMYAPVKFVKE